MLTFVSRIFLTGVKSAHELKRLFAWLGIQYIVIDIQNILLLQFHLLQGNAHVKFLERGDVQFENSILPPAS